MKKTIIFSILVGVFMTIYNGAFAIQTKGGDYEVVELTEGVGEVSIVYENSLIQIVKKDDKYGVFDKKEQQFFMKPVLNDIAMFSKDNLFEYKIKSGDMLGYMNLNTKDTFLSYFNDISILDDKYLKVIKDDKIGITDKKGKIIVPAEFNTVSVTEYDGVEYLSGKTDNKYVIYDTEGRLISENEVYEENKPLYGLSIVRDLNPAIAKYMNIIKPQPKEEDYISKTEDKQEVEIGTLPLPEKIKVYRAEIEKKDRTSIVSTNYEETELTTDTEIAASPVPPNVKKLSVRQEGYKSAIVQPRQTERANELISLNNREYYMVNNNGRLGVKTKYGRDVVPAEYDSLTIKTINPKEAHDIIAAVNTKYTKLYDTNGDVIAKKYKDKASIYTSMRKYEYYKEDIFDDLNIYTVSFNGKKVGEIELFKDGTYEYTRRGFNLSNMNKANELFVTLMNAE